jgi:hypothetical protein
MSAASAQPGGGSAGSGTSPGRVARVVTRSAVRDSRLRPHDAERLRVSAALTYGAGSKPSTAVTSPYLLVS